MRPQRGFTRSNNVSPVCDQHQRPEQMSIGITRPCRLRCHICLTGDGSLQQ